MALAGSFSVVYQLPEPKLAVLESVGGLHQLERPWLKSGVVSPDLTKTTQRPPQHHNEVLKWLFAGSFSVVYQLPEPKLAGASVGGCTVTRTAMVEEWCSFA
jgi:hypothetical protein